MKKLFLLMFVLSSLNFVYASERAPQDYIEESQAEDIDLRGRTRLEHKKPSDHPVLLPYLNSYDEFIFLPNKKDEGLILETDLDEDFRAFGTAYKFKLVENEGETLLEREKLFNYRNIYGIYNIYGKLLVHYKNLYDYEVKKFIN